MRSLWNRLYLIIDIFNETELKSGLSSVLTRFFHLYLSIDIPLGVYLYYGDICNRIPSASLYPYYQ